MGTSIELQPSRVWLEVPEANTPDQQSVAVTRKPVRRVGRRATNAITMTTATMRRITPIAIHGDFFAGEVMGVAGAVASAGAAVTGVPQMPQNGWPAWVGLPQRGQGAENAMVPRRPRPYLTASTWFPKGEIPSGRRNRRGESFWPSEPGSSSPAAWIPRWPCGGPGPRATTSFP